LIDGRVCSGPRDCGVKTLILIFSNEENLFEWAVEGGPYITLY